MRQIESAALEDQVVDWILEQGAITDKPMTFKELTGFGQEQVSLIMNERALESRPDGRRADGARRACL